MQAARSTSDMRRTVPEFDDGIILANTDVRGSLEWALSLLEFEDFDHMSTDGVIDCLEGPNSPDKVDAMGLELTKPRQRIRSRNGDFQGRRPEMLGASARLN